MMSNTFLAYLVLVGGLLFLRSQVSAVHERMVGNEHDYTVGPKPKPEVSQEEGTITDEETHFQPELGGAENAWDRPYPIKVNAKIVFQEGQKEDRGDESVHKSLKEIQRNLDAQLRLQGVLANSQVKLWQHISAQAEKMPTWLCVLLTAVGTAVGCCACFALAACAFCFWPH